MDYTATIFDLVKYETWCNLKVADFMSKLPEEQCHRDFGFGLRTPHHTLFHIADVMQGWGGCVGPVVKPPVWLTYNKQMPISEIRARLLQYGTAFEAAAAQAHEQELLTEDGRLKQLLHLVTHGTHHRGQLLSMFTLLGYSQPIEGGDFGGWFSKSASG